MSIQDYIGLVFLLFNAVTWVVQFKRSHQLTVKAVEKALYNNRVLIANILKDVAMQFGPKVLDVPPTAGKDQSMIKESSPASVSGQVKS